MSKTFVTYDMLKKRHACGPALRWFAQNYGRNTSVPVTRKFLEDVWMHHGAWLSWLTERALGAGRENTIWHTAYHSTKSRMAITDTIEYRNLAISALLAHPGRRA